MDFEQYLIEKHNITLNPQQREAVLHTEGPMLLLAVPGSGKTTVIVCRCAYMTLCRGILPQRILTLTFNKAAQRDMESRFQRLFGADVPAPVRFSTIHSFCYGVLREFGELVGRKVPRLIDEEKPRLLRRLYAEHNNNEFLPDDLLEELSNRIGYVKNMLMTTQQIQETPHDIKSFPAVFDAYERFKSENGCMDFDDMLDKALAAFKVKPQLLERSRSRYTHINVDEAQDTSKLQHEIIRRLAAPANNLFMVGDEDQSIYMFRAADPQYLLDFKAVYANATVLKMETNYRSTNAVVEAADRLIKRNKQRHDKRMCTGNGQGQPVIETVLADNSMLCAHVVKRLQERTELRGTAILYRENTSAVPLMDALERAGIPFYVREHKLHFFEHWVVKDVLAFINLAHNPADIVSFKQIYFKLNAYITRQQYEQAAQNLAQSANVFDAVLSVENLKEIASARIIRIKAHMAKLKLMEPGKAVQFILETLEYAAYLKKAGGREGFFSESLLQKAESLRGIASQTGSLEAFFARIAEMSTLVERARSNWGGNAVTLSTVHSAKGLEFDRVIIVDLFDGRFPSASSIAQYDKGEKQSMEEERRLFYVAATRAKYELEAVTASKIYSDKVKPSRFIRELIPSALHPRRALGKLDHLVSSLMDRDVAQPGAALMIQPGMGIFHKSFGRGEVLTYDSDNDTVSVQFPKYGIKTFCAEYSLLRKILNPEGA